MKWLAAKTPDLWKPNANNVAECENSQHLLATRRLCVWMENACERRYMVVSMCVSQVIGWQKQNEKTRTKLNRDWCGWVGYTHQTHHLGVMWCQSASNVWRHQIQIHCGSRYYPLQTISSPSDHDSEAINFGWHALFCPIIVATKQIQQMLDI